MLNFVRGFYSEAPMCVCILVGQRCTKDIRKKVEKLKKGDTIFIRKGQILVDVARQKAFEVHIYKAGASKWCKKKEQEGKTIKRAKTIPSYNKFMLGVHPVTLVTTQKNDLKQLGFIFLVAYGCPVSAKKTPY